MSGEIKGIRAGRDEMTAQLRDAGHTEKAARKIAAETMKRCARRIEQGTNPKPQIRDNPANVRK